ncbi:MAG: hypothetical protein EBZ49_00880 [Proteobacteria bacterium]|nr:hypothetical protein [Pseudomonadota bacterium]
MAKTLNQILELYEPKSKDEKRFMDKHIVAKSKLDDRGTRDDKVFNATNVKTLEREPKHGYNPGNDEKVYEEKTHPMALHVKPAGNGKYKVMKVGDHLSDGIKVGEHLSDSELDDATEMGAKIKQIQEKTLTPAEMKKREEVAKAIEGENPKMPMAKKMAIATATAKKVAEETIEESEEAHAQFLKYHNDAAGLLKKISTALSKHYDAVTDKKGYNRGEAHWGHVGDIKNATRQLQDLHDNIMQTVDYTKPINMKESAEITEDDDLTTLLNTIYENLSDDNKEIFEQILEQSPDQMIEFLEQLELESNNG